MKSHFGIQTGCGWLRGSEWQSHSLLFRLQQHWLFYLFYSPHSLRSLYCRPQATRTSPLPLLAHWQIQDWAYLFLIGFCQKSQERELPLFSLASFLQVHVQRWLLWLPLTISHSMIFKSQFEAQSFILLSVQVILLQQWKKQQPSDVCCVRSEIFVLW